MRVLIGGGSGFVGDYLIRLLSKHGHKFTLISRTVGPNRITWHDLEKSGLPSDCDAIVNLAGENLMNITKRWTNDFKSSLLTSRKHTNQQIVKLIEKSTKRPKVWINTSAVGYYPPSLTETYDEDSPGGDGDFLAQLCKECEEAAFLPPSVTDVRHVTVRLGIVLGRNGGLIQNLFMPWYFCLGGRMGSGRQWLPWIEGHDAARLYLFAIENEKLKGVINGVAPEICTNQQFTKALSTAMRRPAVFPVPELTIQTVFGPDRAKAILVGQRVLPKRTLEYGYKFQYPDILSACRAALKFRRPNMYNSD